MVILAAYTVYMAKMHADGCGGETHIAKLENSGGSSFVPSGEIKWIEAHIESLESYLGIAFLGNADLNVPDETADAMLEAFKTSLQNARLEHRLNKVRIEQARQKMREAIEARKKRVRVTPSTSQKSEPGP